MKSSESSDHPRETSVRKLFKFYFEIPLLVSPLSSKNIFDPPLPVRNHWRRSAVSSLPVSPKIANRERTILQCCCSLTCKSAPPRMHAFSHAPRINLRVRVRSQEACANVCHATEKYRFSTMQVSSRLLG